MEGITINHALDSMIDNFCETMGYKRTKYPQFSNYSEEASIDEIFYYVKRFYYFSIEELFFPYNPEPHINRVCHAIEEKTFPYKISRRLKKHFKDYKRDRWLSEKKMYGFRLRWQIRLNRLFPSANIRIPAIDEIINHKTLRFFSALNCISQRIRYKRKYKTLDDFYYMDIRYGHPIKIEGAEINIRKLLFPQASNLETKEVAYMKRAET